MKSFLVRMINDLEEDTNKQMNLTQAFEGKVGNEKISNMNDKVNTLTTSIL